MTKFIKILFALLISTVLAHAQDSIPAPSVRIDTAVLAIGDQTHLKISIPVPAGKKGIFPDFKEKIGESLEVLSKTIDTLDLKDNIQQVTHDYLITSFDTGYISIPPFEIGIEEKGYNSTVSTDSLKLYVTYPIVDTKKGIFDIKPPADLPFSFKELLPFLKNTGLILFILIAIAAIVLYYFLIYKKKKSMLPTEPVDTRPADVKAIEALMLLKEKQLWQTGAIKHYYSELTDIIRVYLDERFEMHTMESTSNEILTALKNQNLPIEDSILLKEIFQHADMAKFAKGEPLPHENDKSWNDTTKFIKRTKQIVTLEVKKEVEND